ncbi:MAG: hypothetical protein AABW90_00895 [Nanoarchaeota archaeon]
MGKYTVYEEKVDEFIEKYYLQKIVSSFLKDIKAMNNKMISIILFGGFGKGEGSIQFINNKFVPYNDFDFYIITEKKLSDKELNKISMNASKEIGMGGLEIAYFPEQEYDSKKFFHIDVRCIPYDHLSKLMKIQRYYELKYGSRVIYGDKTVLHKIKEIKPEEIPFSEGLRNLFNKLHTMLLGLSKSYNKEQEKIKIFWSYKCYLSICEALLLLDRKFAPTSVERANLFINNYKKDFPDLYEIIPNLPEKVRKATRFKLKLDFNINHKKLWDIALKDILIVFKYYLKKFVGGDNNGAEDIGSGIINYVENGDIKDIINNKLPYTYFKPYLNERIGFNFFLSQYLLNFGYFNVLRKKDKIYFKPLLNWKDVGLRMILPVYYLLKAYQEVEQEIKQENIQEIPKSHTNQIMNSRLNKKIIKTTLNNHNLTHSINLISVNSNSNNSDDENLIINSEYLNKTYNELKKFIKLDNKDFWYLREKALKAYGLYYQQRLL